jgi:peptidoglycan/LPS O-acetylase OafA/YrhL
MAATIAREVAVRTPPVDVRVDPRRGFGYQKSLDGVRGYAIVLVMLLHMQAMAGGKWEHFLGGYIGVDVFFVLSGFLITSLLLQEWGNSGTVSLKKFYMRRALRLLPALVLLVGALAVGVKLFGLYLHVTAKTVLAALFYVGNWVIAFDVFDMGALHHTWSLSIEEQFYMVWPLLILGMLRSRLRPAVIAAVLALGVAAVAVGRFVFWVSEAVSHHRFYQGLDARADTLLVGCLVGVLLYHGMLPTGARARVLYRALGATGAAFILYWAVFAPSYTAFFKYGGCTAVSLSAGLIILSLQFPIHPAVGMLVESPVPVWFGRLSYSLYLWHYPMYIFAKQFADWPSVAILQIGLSLVTACLSYYCVEKPFLRLKKRYEAR